MQNKLIDELIELAMREDLGDGDHTSLACIPGSARGKARLLVKQEGILAGTAIGEQIFRRLDPHIEFEQFIGDGIRVKPGDIVFVVAGKVQTILKSERLVLNIMQRMSGIATQTGKFVQQLHGLKTKILDTRKTTPGMRMLDKLAVRTGGGHNHRIGLFDMILIKDNHIDYAGGVENAINRTKKYLSKENKKLQIEVEARNLDDITKIMAVGGVDIIMLDNFSLQQTRNAVKMINGQYKTESSGGINLENLREYALCGVDYISVGALTHQIQSLDLSLKAFDY
jgi:nicotinate-nucleotide pyrophosphorylase (carboxylating)